MAFFPFSGELLNPDVNNADNSAVKAWGWGRAVVVLALMSSSAMATPGGTETNIDDLRVQAQDLGTRVTALEQRLSRLSARAADLNTQMQRTSAAIGFLELQKHELDMEYEEAQSRFVARAVEAYKDGPTSDIEMVLGAEDISQILTLVEAQGRAADEDARSLALLDEARQDADHKQDDIDMRQQQLIRQHAAADALVTNARETVDERRAVLHQVAGQIRELEEQARLAAAAAARPTAELLRLLAPSGPAPDIPDDFIGTGVRFEGVASWYGPGFEGDHTASGDVFDSQLYTAASRDLPLGTWLFVTYGGRGVVVLINDRGPYVDDRVLDLSQAAAQALGISGLGWVEAEILIKA